MNYGVGEDSWKSLGTARRSNQSILKISPGCSLEDWCWSWNSNTLTIWWEELTHWKRLWCWKRLKAGGEGDDRGWEGWMASPTQWSRSIIQSFLLISLISYSNYWLIGISQKLQFLTSTSLWLPGSLFIFEALAAVFYLVSLNEVQVLIVALWEITTIICPSLSS